VKRFSNLRPFVKTADILEAIKMMRGFNPKIVVPGHVAPGSVKILEDMEKYYTLLLERVNAMGKQGKSLNSGNRGCRASLLKLVIQGVRKDLLVVA
jgi:hypothetical protein